MTCSLHFNPFISFFKIFLNQREKTLTYPGVLMKTGFWAVKMLGTVKQVIRDSEANWIRQYQPEIWKKTDKFVYLSGFFISKLVGK